MELHVDLLPPEMRETHTAVVNGLKMGGNLSVRFPEGFDSIVKAGGDEVIFKMYCTNESYCAMEKVKQIPHKNEGKGNMKAVMEDEIVGLGGNCIPKEKMEEFQRKQKPGFWHYNPYFVEWEYGKDGEEKGIRHWTSEHMNKLVREFIELLNSCIRIM